MQSDRNPARIPEPVRPVPFEERQARKVRAARAELELLERYNVRRAISGHDY